MCDKKTEIEKLINSVKGYTCLIRNWQMWEVTFYDEWGGDKPEYIYQHTDLSKAIKGAIELITKKKVKKYA